VANGTISATTGSCKRRTFAGHVGRRCDEPSDKTFLLPIVKSQTSPTDSSVDKLAITATRLMSFPITYHILSVNRDSFSVVYVSYSGRSQCVAFVVHVFYYSFLIQPSF